MNREIICNIAEMYKVFKGHASTKENLVFTTKKPDGSIMYYDLNIRSMILYWEDLFSKTGRSINDYTEDKK